SRREGRAAVRLPIGYSTKVAQRRNGIKAPTWLRYVAYASPNVLMSISSSTRIRYAYAGNVLSRDAVRTSRLPDAIATPFRQSRDPKYPGWRTQRYGPLRSMACLAWVNNVRV